MPDDSTLVQLFARRAADDGPRTAIHVKRDGAYTSLTWRDVARDVLRASAGLIDAGVAPGDRVILLSENRYEWIVCDLAIQFALAINTPIHAPLTGEQIVWQINDSGAEIVLLSGAAQAEKLQAVAESLHRDVACYTFDGCDLAIGRRAILPFSKLQSEQNDDRLRDIELQALEAVQPTSLATILYTSGTTGEPKGVMLTQRNLASNTIGTLAAFEQTRDDLRLNFLPLSHIFGRTCDLYTWIVTGSELALAESRETVVADCRALRPTLINAVPYFFDKIYRAICDAGHLDQPDVLRDFLGGRLRMVCSGGAALPDHVFDFFTRQGVPILQGYGLTETSPVITACTPMRNKKGTVGPAIPDVEVRVAADGEIETRGPHVMRGYYKNPAATDEVLHDGWLRTGDLGALDDDGFLRITGRKKEIIVTSGGKNVPPVMIESLLTQDPLIVQALVVGDGRDYLVALLVPDPDNLRSEIVQRGIAVASREQALAHPEVLALYEERVRQRLAGVSYYEQVRKFQLLPRGFSIEQGEMTAKLSLRRQVIEKHFAAEIEAMYRRTGEAECLDET
ncbi:MAG: AMP-dependent synthetase/ligase [Pirellulaceae bacterium]